MTVGSCLTLCLSFPWKEHPHVGASMHCSVRQAQTWKCGWGVLDGSVLVLTLGTLGSGIWGGMMTNNETAAYLLVPRSCSWAVTSHHGVLGQSRGAWLVLAVHPSPPTRNGGGMPGCPPHAMTCSGTLPALPEWLPPQPDSHGWSGKAPRFLPPCSRARYQVGIGRWSCLKSVDALHRSDLVVCPRFVEARDSNHTHIFSTMNNYLLATVQKAIEAIYLFQPLWEQCFQFSHFFAVPRASLATTMSYTHCR